MDSINPDHYKKGSVEAFDAILSATVDKRGGEAVCVSNVIRYLWRYESKGGLTDVRKARWYLDHLIELLEKGPQALEEPAAVVESQVGQETAQTLRWVGIDLQSDLLKQVADEMEVSKLLLDECAPHVPESLRSRIREVRIG